MGNRPTSSTISHGVEHRDNVDDNNTRRLEDLYTINSKKLGRGHYATVWQGVHKKTGKEFAIKRIKRALTDEKRLQSEINVLKRVGKHPNIVELVDVFETPREVQLVMELCTGGELFERLASKGPYSEADCARHIRAMASAVKYLHSKGIVHRDLKPENILLSSMDDKIAVVKVADFGLAKIMSGTNLKTKCGTWGYSAPEMVSGTSSSFGYDAKVDSWSLGTIAYILLCGFHPFDPQGTSTDREMMSAIKKCAFDFNDEAWAGIKDGAKDLICNLLVLNPIERLTMDEVLKHTWLQGVEGVHLSVTPLSPTIHKDLARFRSHSARSLSLKDDTIDQSMKDDLDEFKLSPIGDLKMSP